MIQQSPHPVLTPLVPGRLSSDIHRLGNVLPPSTPSTIRTDLGRQKEVDLLLDSPGTPYQFPQTLTRIRRLQQKAGQPMSLSSDLMPRRPPTLTDGRPLPFPQPLRLAPMPLITVGTAPPRAAGGRKRRPTETTDTTRSILRHHILLRADSRHRHPGCRTQLLPVLRGTFRSPGPGLPPTWHRAAASRPCSRQSARAHSQENRESRHAQAITPDPPSAYAAAQVSSAGPKRRAARARTPPRFSVTTQARSRAKPAPPPLPLAPPRDATASRNAYREGMRFLQGEFVTERMR